MRILQMTDVHGSEDALERSRWALEEYGPDLFLVTGDITNFGPLAYARRFLEDRPVPTRALPGNCDPRDIVPLLEELEVSLHGRRTEIRGVTLVGLGGSNGTPFGTPFELSETEIRSSLEPLLEEGVVLATHAPARGHLDVPPGGGHVGSTALRELVDRYRPRLHLSGHIHEARGVEEADGTTFVNPGPALRGHAAVVDMEDGAVSVTLLP